MSEFYSVAYQDAKGREEKVISVWAPDRDSAILRAGSDLQAAGNLSMDLILVKVSVQLETAIGYGSPGQHYPPGVPGWPQVP